jgi:hypothetical protein
MGDRSVEATRSAARHVVEPFDVEAVLAQRLVLEPDVVSLLLVGGEPVGAGATQGVSGQLGQPVESFLGPPPVRRGLRSPVRLAGDVVTRRTAREGETAVATAGALRDRSRLVDADAKARLGKAERRGASGYAAADDRDVDAAVVRTALTWRNRVFEPVRIQDVKR